MAARMQARPHFILSPIPPDARALHLRWLLQLTQVPTASGAEAAVLHWLHAWFAQRPSLRIAEDPHGNLTVSLTPEPDAPAPLYFTAHLDHPAFVVDDVPAFDTVELSFRGGVMPDYFVNARIRIHTAGEAGDTTRLATITAKADLPGSPVFDHWYARLDPPTDPRADHAAPAPKPGDVAVWALPPAELNDGLVHTLACDDLAALAAALAAFDYLIPHAAELTRPVRLLLTRAEEIGFIGAIGACRSRTIPLAARIIALENSRSFADSPIGGGPVVRVGDRVSVFSPTLSDAIAARAEEIAGGGAIVAATQKLTAGPSWKWQRKLMAGGACEASVFCHFGYEATCVCLPLGNYHNMGDLANVQAGTNTNPPTIEREFIALSDFEGLVDLLVACAFKLGESGKVSSLVTRLWDEKSFVLNQPRAP